METFFVLRTRFLFPLPPSFPPAARTSLNSSPLRTGWSLASRRRAPVWFASSRADGGFLSVTWTLQMRHSQVRPQPATIYLLGGIEPMRRSASQPDRQSVKLSFSVPTAVHAKLRWLAAARGVNQSVLAAEFVSRALKGVQCRDGSAPEIEPAAPSE